MNMVDAKNMSSTERILAMEILWESMCSGGDEVESPNWHEGILDARRQKISGRKSGFVTLEQLREQLSK